MKYVVLQSDVISIISFGQNLQSSFPENEMQQTKITKPYKKYFYTDDAISQKRKILFGNKWVYNVLVKHTKGQIWFKTSQV